MVKLRWTVVAAASLVYCQKPKVTNAFCTPRPQNKLLAVHHGPPSSDDSKRKKKSNRFRSRASSSILVGPITSASSSSTRLHAVSVAGAAAAEQTVQQGSRRWHRRVLQRVVRGRSGTRGESSSTETTDSSLQHLQSSSAVAAPVTGSSRSSLDQALFSGPSSSNGTDAFVLQDYDERRISSVFPPELLDTPALQRELAQVGVKKSSSSPSTATTTTLVEDQEDDIRGSPITRVTRGWAETALTGLLDRWSHGIHENMQIKCEPQGSVMELVKGYFRCDAVVEFDRIAFPFIQMSGGRLESDRLALNLYRFAPISKAVPRFPDQFDLTAHDMIFKEEDLFGSSCIRNGLKTLLTRILRRKGLTANKVEISSISILPSGKVSCKGEARVLGSPVPFEVRSGLATASRGHILTFPGLEISLAGPSIGLFVPVIPEITVDLGHNAQLTGVRLDGDAKTLTVSCKTTIVPRHTVKLLSDYHQDTHAYAAQHYVDVGSWLTRVGKFSN